MRKEYFLIGAAAAIAVASSASAASRVSTRVNSGSLYNLTQALVPFGTPSTEDPVGSYFTSARESTNTGPSFSISDPSDTVNDDIVNFDGVSEAIQRHFAIPPDPPTTPIASESVVINADGSQTLTFDLTAQGPDLYAGGFVDSAGNPLTAVLYFVGSTSNPVTSSNGAWGAVKAATLNMFDAAGSFFGPNGADVSGFFAGNWDGRFGVRVTGAGGAALTGTGITKATFSITVNKIPTPGALALFGIAGLAATRRRR